MYFLRSVRVSVDRGINVRTQWKKLISRSNAVSEFCNLLNLCILSVVLFWMASCLIPLDLRERNWKLFSNLILTYSWNQAIDWWKIIGFAFVFLQCSVHSSETEVSGIYRNLCLQFGILQEVVAAEREPMQSNNTQKPHILLAACGSVAALKFQSICYGFCEWAEVRAVATRAALFFIDRTSLPKNVFLYIDDDDWTNWGKIGDSVLHIQLCNWADVMVIAPLSANTLGKVCTIFAF